MNKAKILILTIVCGLFAVLSACSSANANLVTFDSNGGSIVEYQLVEPNESATVPNNPFKIGYEFISWELNGIKYSFNSVVTEDIELKATWEAKDIYSVYFVTSGSNGIASQSIYEGEYASTPATPVKTDYTFIEWRLNGVKYDFSTPVTQDITLTAVWQEVIYKYYTVTFENTDISTEIVKEGNLVTKPSDPEKVNNTFEGWYVDDKPFDFSTPITSNTIITAKWEEMTFEANQYSVSSVSEWNSLAKTLTPGDVVTFKNGEYSGTSLARIESYVQGTASQKIIIQAESNDGVIIKDTVNWQIHGSHITISGFTFKDGYPKSSSGAIVLYGDYIRLTNITMDAFDNPGTAANNYSDASKTGYVSVQDGAMFAEIDHCTFINKTAQGCLLLVDKNNYAGPTYAHIHDNYFGSFKNVAGLSNEYETIRVGISSMSQTDSYTVIENNIFEDIDAETELISIKSCRNVIRNNLILNCASAITLRHGNTNLVENNVILGNNIEDSNGIRVFDAYHVIRNNYISGIAANSSTFYGGIVIHNGNNAVGKDGNSLSGQWTANNLLIENNSFVNNDTNICLGDSRYEVAPGNLTFENNLVYTSTGNSIRQYDSLNDSYSQKSHIATNVTYSNEYYFANALGLVDSIVPEGINFDTNLANASLVTLENGLMYSPLAGASNLELVNEDNACVQDEVQEAANLSKEDYESYFQDWPFKAIYVDMPEMNDILADHTGAYLEDSLDNWKTSSSEIDKTTFNESVLKITAGGISTTNSLALGDNSGYVAASFDVYFEDVSKAVMGFKLYSGSTSSVDEISRIKIEDAKVKFQYSTGALSDGTLKTEYNTYATLESKTWYNITVVYITELDSSVTTKANIYINGELQNEEPVVTLRSTDVITHGAFFSDSGQSANTFYINNFTVVSRETGF